MLQISHAAGRAAVAKRGVFLKKKKKNVCAAGVLRADADSVASPHQNHSGANGGAGFFFFFGWSVPALC